MAGVVLQRALIRSAHAMLGILKGALRAWEEYVDARERELKSVETETR